MPSSQTKRTFATFLIAFFVGCVLFSPVLAQENTGAAPDQPSNHSGAAVCPVDPVPIALLAGDSWAQLMWDDGSHNDIFDKFGHADKQMLSRSLSDDPGSGYSGPEYAVSGSEARQWANTASYPWIANMVAELQAQPTINTVVLSIDGNDVLAGKSGGGWYKDMDLDVPGSEAALFAQIEADTWQIVNATLAVRPEIEVLLSSYDYPNFNVGFWCFTYACPKRRDLSRDPTNDLITDVQLNAMMITIEQQRLAWTNSSSRFLYDNSIGLMHYFYGDGLNGPGTLPYPGQTAPDYAPFPGGNSLRPTLRGNFRPAAGFIDADPIHLDYDAYQYKISNQTMSTFFPRFRGTPRATFFSLGDGEDGWTDGTTTGTDFVTVGSVGGVGRFGLISLDTSALPDNAIITGATLYLMRQGGTGTSPFQSGALGLPVVDIAGGSFGTPAVEAADATAPATAANAGCTTGTARQDDYAVRVNLTAEGLAAINRSGRTQFRLSFANPGGASSAAVSFNNGEALLLTGDDRLVRKTRKVLEQLPDGRTIEVLRSVLAIEHQGLAEYMASPRPFLDIDYCLPQETGCATSQEIALDAGWNTISSAVKPTDPALETALAGIESDLVVVKNGAGQIYWPSLDINGIDDWDVRAGYQTYMLTPATLTLTGSQVDPTQTPIHLPTGWNTAAYLRTSPLPVDQALAGISSALLLVKNNAGDIYWPEFGINQIGQMQPGQGYQLFLSSAATLVYPGN